MTEAGSGRYRLATIDMDVSKIETAEHYSVGEVDVYITTDGRYMVREPPIGKEAEDLYDSIIKKIDMGVGMDPDDDDPKMLASKFEDAFWDTARRLERLEEAQKSFKFISYYVKRDMIGFGILDVLMNDPQIEDILASAYGRDVRVIHKKYSGQWHTLKTNIQFADLQAMTRFIQRVYGRTGTEPTESKPISVTYMADGSRISATFGSQVSKPGPVIAIRKFPANPLTITHMMNGGTITAEMAAYIWTLLDAKAVGLVIGVTGSGKTTLLSSFVSMMNPRWRILTIEDTLELQIPHADWVRYNTRKSYGMLSKEFDISISDLIDSSLTQKPDYELIGEIRLSDMDSLFQSVGTGHGGLTSFHASTPLGALTRMRGRGISDGELALLWFTVHSVVVQQDGQNVRRVGDIAEIIPDEKTGHVEAQVIYQYDIMNDAFDPKVKLDEAERYLEAVHVCGIRDAKKDMNRRVELLDECVEKKALDIPSVFSILGKYYQ